MSTKANKRTTKGFLREIMHLLAEVTRLAVDHNMSARARIVEIIFRQEKAYDIRMGTTMVEDRVCAPQLEAAMATVMGLLPASSTYSLRRSRRRKSTFTSVCTSGCSPRSSVQFRRYGNFGTRTRRWGAVLHS